MATEADWSRWTGLDLKPYLEVACKALGEDRLMIGSDWPFYTLAGDYGQILGTLEMQLPTNLNKEKILKENAMAFYHLPSLAPRTAKPS